MRVDSILQKMEIYLVATVAVALVCGVAFALSSPFSAQDYGVAGSCETSAKGRSAPSQESQPALLEPALRSVDSVSYHG